MTITIKRRTAVLFVALTCVLAGLAIGQLTQARSAASNYQLSEIANELKKVNRALGSSYAPGTVIGSLNNIESSSSATCNSVKSGFGTFYTGC